MFDVGFSELVLIGIIALLVLGPERLPKAARTAGLWAGRARRFLANVKADIDRELKAEELREIMQKQSESSGIHEIVEQTRSTVGEIKSAAAGVANAASSISETKTAPENQPAPALQEPAGQEVKPAVQSSPEPKSHGQ